MKCARSITRGRAAGERSNRRGAGAGVRSQRALRPDGEAGRQKACASRSSHAHNDYTLKSGPQRVRDLLPEEAEALLKNRFAVINVWRPIRGPVEEMPLAVCDARSIARRDLVPTDLKYPDRTGEVHSLAFNPAHRWFFIPAHGGDEVILLKCYDSADDGRARFTAHGAFVDPATRPRGRQRGRVSKSARWRFFRE